MVFVSRDAFTIPLSEAQVLHRTFTIKEKKMAVQNLRYKTAYGLSDPLLSVFPSPIVSQRSPSPNDGGQIGQVWVNTLTNQVYTLSSVEANVYNWAVSSTGGGGLTTAHTDAGDATTLANAMTFAGGTNINTAGAAHTVTINVANNPTFSGLVTAQAGLTVSGGNLVVSTGTITASIGSITSGTNITAGTGLKVNTFTAGVVQSGATGILSSSNGANGEILIGGGVAPVWTTITPGANIAIVNGANSITISANTGSETIRYTGVSTTPYVALSTDDYLGVDSTGGPITIELPNAPATGRVFIIKDTFGDSAANNITVTTVGGAVNFDANPSVVMTSAFEAIQVIFNGTFYEIF
jgi:hypothetical protein